MPVFSQPPFYRSTAPRGGAVSGHRFSRHTVQLYATPLGPSTVVIKARGYIDASNATELDVCVRKSIGYCIDVLIDLSGLEFIGIDGLSVLMALHESLEAQVVVIPNPAVTRLLRLYSPAPDLIISSEVSVALAASQGPGLYLVDDAI